MLSKISSSRWSCVPIFTGMIPRLLLLCNARPKQWLCVRIISGVRVRGKRDPWGQGLSEGRVNETKKKIINWSTAAQKLSDATQEDQSHDTKSKCNTTALRQKVMIKSSPKATRTQKLDWTSKKDLDTYEDEGEKDNLLFFFSFTFIVLKTL
jgi:hypothetical protein